jgi:outer membrane autotransporter protein
MPFARVDAIKATIEPYAEAISPLPAEYYATQEHQRVARFGIEGIARPAQNIKLWLRGNWGHRTSENPVETTGKLVGLFTGFTVPRTSGSQNWAEAGLGLGWRLQQGMLLQASVGGASDGKANPSVSGALGLSWRL